MNSKIEHQSKKLKSEKSFFNMFQKAIRNETHYYNFSVSSFHGNECVKILHRKFTESY